MDSLQSGKDISAADRRIEGYESHFIRFILRDQLYSAMKAFKPHSVLISYSGKTQVENDHFLEMMQEIVKICPKVTFFPNLTSALLEHSDYKATEATRSIGRGIIAREDESSIAMRIDNFY
jgi:hypothetical protein